jgi:hypothetical protein
MSQKCLDFNLFKFIIQKNEIMTKRVHDFFTVDTYVIGREKIN